ncbi:hypothetical protein HGRIS_001894 [Hohenbuehelia grisea]|uniref:Tocopherol cyclase n=1 Tax=Hohenbuehelia grisea TaxID=104357 RepID=A0ABR3JJY3_9AGAR
MRLLPRLKSLLIEPLSLLLSLTPLRRVLPRQNHFYPHPGAPFEGYYTRILTTNGSTVLLIFSSVYKAPHKPSFVHFSLLRPGAGDAPGPGPGSIIVDAFPQLQEELSADGSHHTFSVNAHSPSSTSPDTVEATASYVTNPQSQQYRLHLLTPEYGELDIAVELTRRSPWVSYEPHSSPEGIFANLVFLLPLHWHVYSTASRADVTVRRGDEVLERSKGIAHVEKNWGVEFPDGWVWVQAFKHPPRVMDSESEEIAANHIAPIPSTTTFSLAGGKILGQRAYLLGFQSPTIGQWSFRPLWTLLPFGFRTPFCTERVDARAGTFELTVCGIWRKLIVRAEAPPDHAGWVPMACPLARGHGNTFAYESFDARVHVQAFERAGLGWKLVEDVWMENGALEFGGDYSFKAKMD